MVILLIALLLSLLRNKRQAATIETGTATEGPQELLLKLAGTQPGETISVQTSLLLVIPRLSRVH